MSQPDQSMSMGARLRQSSGVLGDAIVVRSIRGIDDFSEIGWLELDRRSDRVAAALLRMDVLASPATVLLLTRNAVDHAVYAYGAWKAGQTVLCLSPIMGSTEGTAILSRLGRTISVGAQVTWDTGERFIPLADEEATPALEDRVANPMLLVATGGSTGIPKLVDVLGAGQFTPGAFLGGLNQALKRRPRAKAFIMTPLSHGAGAATAYMAIFEECQVTSLEKFDADSALWAIERFELEQLTIVPTMMHRMLQRPGFSAERLRSIRSLVHTGGKADPKDKEAWMEALGAEKVVEVWGSSESVGHACIAGDEWLLHRGSVGKPVNCRMRIIDADGNDLPPGSIGEIFVQPLIPKVNLESKYFGSTLKMKSHEGYVSFGDLGYTDGDGYLYISGRTDDLIITGGANVYPDEVEIEIRRLPQVADCVVVPKPHPELHQSVHAVIAMEPGAAPMSIEELRRKLSGHLSPYKIPRSVEYRDEMPRTDAGKIRRSSYRQSAKE